MSVCVQAEKQQLSAEVAHHFTVVAPRVLNSEGSLSLWILLRWPSSKLLQFLANCSAKVEALGRALPIFRV